MMPDYHIGTLDAVSKKLVSSGGESTSKEDDSCPRPVFLDVKQWRRAHLATKTPVSPDTKLFTFTLDHARQELGLPTGQHLLLRLRDPVTREAIIRAYTPYTSSDEEAARGLLGLLVKIYRGGAMTTALDSLPLGHWVEFKGPVGRFEYRGRGHCVLGGGLVSRHVKRLVMVCAGSGVTPILAVLRAVVRDGDGDGKGDAPCCTVLDGNRAEADILCKAELDALVAAAAARGSSRIVHTLSRPGPGWTGARGRMDRALFAREVGPPQGGGDDEMVLVCGPPALEASVRESFADMGWRAEDLVFF